MDLQLYLRVLWRFRLLVVVGFLLALALAFLSHVNVTFDGGGPGFSYREARLWESRASVWVTREGFQAGRTTSSEAAATDFSGLAALYANLAQSDEVRAIMREEGPINGALEVSASYDSTRRSSLPFVIISAFAASPGTAQSLAGRQMNALIQFIENQQDADRIPPSQRVVLEVLKQPTPAALVANRSLTRPIVIFLTVMIAVLGLAFILENLRPSVRPVAQDDVRPIPSRETERRSA
jgi:hypothetical protein